MKISTNQFKNGTKLIIDNAPCSIVEHEFHKPGKGQAVMRIKYKNLITGNTNDKTFKSGESVEASDANGTYICLLNFFMKFVLAA